MSDQSAMLSMIELLTGFLVLTLVVIIALGFFLRRRFAAGRDRPHGSSTDRGTPPAAGEEE